MAQWMAAGTKAKRSRYVTVVVRRRWAYLLRLLGLSVYD